MFGSMTLVAALLAGTVSAQQPGAVPVPDPQLDAAIIQLSSGDPVAKSAAADAIGDRGVVGLAGVPALTKAVADADAEVRWHAARALGAIGPGAAPAVAVLSTALADQNPAVRAYAAYALGRIGEASKPAVPQLVAAMKDSDALVRREALRAIGQIKPGPAVVVPLFIEVIKNSPPSEIMPALHSMAEFGEKVVPGLIEALQHEGAQYWACIVLAEIGPPAKDAVPALIEVLDNPKAEVRREAAMALGRIGAASASAVPKLTSMLNDPASGVNAEAAFALGSIGPASVAALPALQAKLIDSDVMLKTVAAWAIAKIEPMNEAYRQQARSALMAAVRDTQPNIRSAALHGLADLRNNDAATAQAFLTALPDSDANVRKVAMQSVVGLGPAAVEPLTKALSDEKLRPYAAAALGTLGPQAREALPALLAQVNVADPGVKAEIVVAMAAVAPGEASVLQQVQAALADPNAHVRHAAVAGLAILGADKPEIVALLKAVAEKDADPGVRMSALEALPK
jgi:HEAT repeat protein